jgi:hypothetical protein
MQRLVYLTKVPSWPESRALCGPPTPGLTAAGRNPDAHLLLRCLTIPTAKRVPAWMPGLVQHKAGHDAEGPIMLLLARCVSRK